MSFITLNAQTTAIPDANFEQKLITLGIDTNGANGNILNSDALAVTTLNLSNSTITNLTGLEAFTNVVNLDLSNNAIVNISLTTLTVLQILKIEINFVLVSLDISQNVALKTLSLYGNATGVFTPLTTLNLASNINLEEISLRWFRNLNNLTLPVTSSLKKIKIDWLADQTLDFSLLSGLEELNMYYTISSPAIILPTVAPNFKTISIDSIPFFNINLANYTNLQTIFLYATSVQNIVLPNAPQLTDIYIQYHNFQSLVNLTTLPNLKKISHKEQSYNTSSSKSITKFSSR